MNIVALTPSDRVVSILQFVYHDDVLFAVVVHEDGNITELPAEQLTVIDRDYVEE